MSAMQVILFFLTLEGWQNFSQVPASITHFCGVSGDAREETLLLEPLLLASAPPACFTARTRASPHALCSSAFTSIQSSHTQVSLLSLHMALLSASTCRFTSCPGFGLPHALKGWDSHWQRECCSHRLSCYRSSTGCIMGTNDACNKSAG